MARHLIISLFFLTLCLQLNAQTCCSGGIPIGGSVSLENNASNTWQIASTGDLNILRTLKDGRQTLNDQSRKRLIYSLMIKGGYNITNNLAVGAIVPFVRQERWISNPTGNDYAYTQGAGDIIVVSQYQLPFSNSQNNYRLGIGAKLSSGQADLKSQQGITYNMDMQPGTGSTDWLMFGSFDRSFRKTPDMSLTTKIFYRLTGKNTDYLNGSTYQSGNEWQLVAGISKQWLLSTHIINTSLLFKSRQMKTNKINGSNISNTGGIWFDLMPSITYMPTQQVNISVIPEIPLFSDLNGTQLTTSFRIRGALVISLGSSSSGTFEME